MPRNLRGRIVETSPPKRVTRNQAKHVEEERQKTRSTRNRHKERAEEEKQNTKRKGHQS